MAPPTATQAPITAKGVITGNGPADRLLESLRADGPEPRMSQAEAERRVILKRAVRKALPEILAAERRRTVASVRGRLETQIMGHGLSLAGIAEVLDEMESEATP